MFGTIKTNTNKTIKNDKIATLCNLVLSVKTILRNISRSPNAMSFIQFNTYIAE